MRISRVVLIAAGALLALTPARGAAAAPPLNDHPWLVVSGSLDQGGGVCGGDLALSRDHEEKLTKEGHGYVQMLWRYHAHLGGDGVITERITEVRRFLSEQGIQQAGNYVAFARPSRQTMTIEVAYVQTPDGRTVAVDPDTIQVVTNTQPPVFSDAVVVVVPFRDVTRGATAVAVSETRFRGRDWPLPWSSLFVTQLAIPSEKVEAIIEWDEGVPAPTWKTDDETLACHADGSRRIRCTKGYTAPLPPDPQMESVLDLVPHFVVMQPRTWSALAEEVGAIVHGKLTTGSAVATLAQKLTAKASSARERLEALHRFVADDVRYVALNHGENALVPHPAERTLERKFGDCKDKVTLFLALARLADLDAYPVLVATNRHDPSKLLAASLSYFDHMIACVSSVTSDEVCLDLTIPGASTGDLPPVLQGAVTLDLRPGTSGPRVHQSTQYDWQIQVEETNEVNCDGSVEELLERQYRGPGAIMLRGILRELTEQDRVRWAEDGYHEVVTKEVTPSFAFAGVSDSGPTVTIASRARFRGTGTLRERKTWSEWDQWLVNAATTGRGHNRYHPYRHGGLLFTSRIVYQLCPDARIGFDGPALDFHAPFGSLTRSYKHTERTVDAQTALEIPRRTVPAADIEQWNRFIDRALAESRVRFDLAHE